MPSGLRSATIETAGGSSQPLAVLRRAMTDKNNPAADSAVHPAQQSPGEPGAAPTRPTAPLPWWRSGSEILQRSTAMPVVEAGHQMPIERNHVYVIPPNHDMVIERGALS